MHTLTTGPGFATFTFATPDAADHFTHDALKRGVALTADGPTTVTLDTDVPAVRPHGPRLRADGKPF